MIDGNDDKGHEKRDRSCLMVPKPNCVMKDPLPFVKNQKFRTAQSPIKISVSTERTWQLGVSPSVEAAQVVVSTNLAKDSEGENSGEKNSFESGLPLEKKWWLLGFVIIHFFELI